MEWSQILLVLFMSGIIVLSILFWMDWITHDSGSGDDLLLVELVMNIEERFGLCIPDEEAERFVMVGNVHDYVQKQVKRRNECACPTVYCYNQLRDMLTSNFGLERAEVRSDTVLGRVIGESDQPRFYGRFEGIFRLPGNLQYNYMTIGSHARELNQLNPQFFEKTWTDKEIWSALLDSIVKCLGVEPHRVTGETRLNDLLIP